MSIETYIAPITAEAQKLGTAFDTSRGKFLAKVVEMAVARVAAEPGISASQALKWVRGQFDPSLIIAADKRKALSDHAFSTVRTYSSAIAWRLDEKTCGDIRRTFGNIGTHDVATFRDMVAKYAATFGNIWADYKAAGTAKAADKKADKVKAASKLADPIVTETISTEAPDAEALSLAAFNAVQALIELGEVDRLVALYDALGDVIAAMAEPLQIAA
jgi:hypothetical protein